MKRSLLSSLLVCSLILPAFGQDPQTQQPQQISIRSAEVVLDVVVKDKKGKLVKDLNAADLEILEDGEKQQIESFRLVTRPSAGKTAPEKNDKKETSPAPTGKAVNLTAGESDIGVSAIALVFDRLSTDARRRAHAAAMAYAGEGPRPNDFMGVFAIDLSLRVLQNYTTDNTLIRSAIDKAGSSSSASFGSNAELARSQNQTITQLQQQVASAGAAASAAGASGGAGAAAAGSAAGAADVDRQFAEMTRRTLETFEVLERDQQGYATSNGLLAVVNSMRNLPGRKAVVFFSEGLSIPPNVVMHFRSVINNANKSNVSIYAVDSAGLRAVSVNQETRDEINALGRRRVDADSTRPETGRPMTAMLERNEDLLRLNPQSGLTQLANETGGTFIGDTNNIPARLRQVDEELHSYYLVSYVPTNQNIDGKFRQISVKTKHDDWEIQTRKGYFAVNATGYVPMLFYESSALAALNNPNLTNAFQMRAQGFSFPDATRKLHTVVEASIPINSFTFVENHEKKTFSTDFTVLTLVKDYSKQVVAKLSRQYVLTGALNKLDSARSGQVLFYREAELPAGLYEIETVAHDAPSGKASVKRSLLEIVDSDESALRLSTISLIQRAEPIPAGQKNDSVFQVGDVMIYPNLGEAFKKSATKQAGFFFVVYPAKGAKVSPEFTLQVRQGSNTIADLPLKLSAPDAQGRIAYASAFPIDGLNPGTYFLKVTVKDETNSVSRATQFTIEP